MDAFHENGSALSPEDASGLVVDPNGKEGVPEQLLVHVEDDAADLCFRDESWQYNDAGDREDKHRVKPPFGNDYRC